IVRYLRYVKNSVRGDLGASIYNSQKVMTIIGGRVWISVSLVLVAMLFAISLGVPAGIIAALARGTTDRAMSIGAGLCLAIPTFVSSVFLIKWFALDSAWFPAGGYTPLTASATAWFRHLVLPAVALGLFP